MKKIKCIIAFFILSSISNLVFALHDDYTIVTESYVTRKTNGEVANGASNAVTPETTYDVTCYLNQSNDLKGSIVVTINNQQNALDNAHASFSQFGIPAIMNDAGLYGFEEYINGSQIKSQGPYLVTCHLNSSIAKATCS